MTSDRGWQLILLAGVVVIGAILYRHIQRDRPPHEAMRNVSPDGTEFVTPRAKESARAVEEPKLPERVSERDAAASRRAWDDGNYEVSIGDPGVLILENGHERRVFLFSDMQVRRCRKLAAQCIFGPDFEARVNAKLPSNFQQRGTSGFDVRLNMGAPVRPAAPHPAARKAGALSAKTVPPPTKPAPVAPKRN